MAAKNYSLLSIERRNNQCGNIIQRRNNSGDAGENGENGVMAAAIISNGVMWLKKYQCGEMAKIISVMASEQCGNGAMAKAKA
jgi:hypothetical protein